MNQSTWLVGHVEASLRESGCLVAVGRFINGDEIDLIVFHLGETILIECSDKNIDLGDVYKFNGKLTTLGPHQPDRGVIVTTDRVSKDAQAFLDNMEVPIIVVSGDPDKIRGDVLGIMGTVTRSFLERQFFVREEESMWRPFRLKF